MNGVSTLRNLCPGASFGVSHIVLIEQGMQRIENESRLQWTLLKIISACNEYGTSTIHSFALSLPMKLCSSPNSSKWLFTISSVTSFKFAGLHFGFPSLSTSAARMPS